MFANLMPVSFPGMARKPEKTAKPDKDQINFRLLRSTIVRMEAYCAAHPLKPTLTSIVEAGVNEWLDRNELPPKPRPDRK